MAHIDYDRTTTLDALIDVSDAGARATLLRLRERLGQVDAALDERLVFDGRHRKPVLAWFRGDDPVLHLHPEPNVSVGLHVDVPLRVHERKLLDLRGVSDRVREAVARARPRHNVVWVERVLHRPSDADEIVDLVARRIELLPKVH